MLRKSEVLPHPEGPNKAVMPCPGASNAASSEKFGQLIRNLT
jgi:hypothetical protein